VVPIIDLVPGFLRPQRRSVRIPGTKPPFPVPTRSGPLDYFRFADKPLDA